MVSGLPSPGVQKTSQVLLKVWGVSCVFWLTGHLNLGRVWGIKGLGPFGGLGCLRPRCEVGQEHQVDDEEPPWTEICRKAKDKVFRLRV